MSSPAVASGAASPSAGSAGAGVVVADVAGKVRNPGLYRLAPGSRVDDAIKAAGGALAGVRLSSLNLAAKVVDGQQIPVGIAAAPAAGGGAASGTQGGSAGGSASTGPINLNTATAEQLQTLPGVGPVLSQNILDWRSAHGTFGSVEQLNDVPGIGSVQFAALRTLVTV